MRRMDGKGDGKGEGQGEGSGDNRRIEQLEKKLDAVLRELETLRKEKAKERRPSRNRSESADDTL